MELAAERREAENATFRLELPQIESLARLALQPLQ